MNISKTSWPIKIKFHLDHQFSEGLAALGSGPDWISALISMATYNSHWFIMGENLVTNLAPSLSARLFNKTKGKL